MNAYEDLITQLGQLLNIPLKAEQNQTCCLQVGDIKVYIELHHDADKIMLGCYLGELPHGQYRFSVFERALCVNGFTSSPSGILAYSAAKNSLVLFQYFYLDKITLQKLHDQLQVFIAHAKTWATALASETLPDIQISKVPTGGSGMFGLPR